MTSKKMRLGIAFAALAAIGALASVAFAAATSPRSAKLTHVRVGLALIPPKMTFIGFYVARDKGFFKRNGLDVKLMSEGDGVKSLRGTVAGAFDMAGTSADDVIAAAAQGGGVTSVWGYAMPLDSTLVANQNVKTVADLKGKRIAITDPGGFADVQVRAVLAQAHINPSDVHIISMPDRSAFVPAIVAGRIDAAPFHVDDGLAAQEKDPQLHPVKAIYQSLPYWWYGSLAVTDTYKAKNAVTIGKFIAAMDEADRWIYSHRAETIAIGVKETQESKAAVSGAYDFLRKAHEWTVNTGIEQSRVMRTMQFEKSLKQIPRVPKYSEVADPTIANAVVARIGRWKVGY
ncbi:MAG TPA: ABC transporter substrate-binding protein [Gaiellaceae bacterium]